MYVPCTAGLLIILCFNFTPSATHSREMKCTCQCTAGPIFCIFCHLFRCTLQTCKYAPTVCKRKPFVFVPSIFLTSSAVFHFASCPRRFCPAHTLVWMILRKSCPVLGLKMKMAPLMGLVVRLPSKVCITHTRRKRNININMKHKHTHTHTKHKHKHTHATHHMSAQQQRNKKRNTKRRKTRDHCCCCCCCCRQDRQTNISLGRQGVCIYGTKTIHDALLLLLQARQKNIYTCCF